VATPEELSHRDVVRTVADPGGRGSHRSPTEHGSALVLLGVEEGQDMVEDAVRDVGKTVLL
jgi:hypothetical protein